MDQLSVTVYTQSVKYSYLRLKYYLYKYIFFVKINTPNIKNTKLVR
jgi:hypothetical protein